MIVYTVGTFDLLHVGHLALLEYCKSLGDTLAVGVASDRVVNSYKPNVPVIIAVASYLKSEGKQINQVLYNPRTSSTRIKQNTVAQSHRRNYIEQAVA